MDDCDHESCQWKTIVGYKGVMLLGGEVQSNDESPGAFAVSSTGAGTTGSFFLFSNLSVFLRALHTFISTVGALVVITD